MTATVDLILLRKVRGGEEIPLYEGEWLFTDFTSTAGLLTQIDNVWKVTDPGRGIFFESLFGDGPTRLGMKTYRPVVLVDYAYAKTRELKFSNFSRPNSPKNRYLVARTKVMEAIISSIKKYDRNKALHALHMKEFMEVMRKIPPESSFWREEVTSPMMAFLEKFSDRDVLIVPIIGHGLSRYWNDWEYMPINHYSIITIWY